MQSDKNNAVESKADSGSSIPPGYDEYVWEHQNAHLKDQRLIERSARYFVEEINDRLKKRTVAIVLTPSMHHNPIARATRELLNRERPQLSSDVVDTDYSGVRDILVDVCRVIADCKRHSRNARCVVYIDGHYLCRCWSIYDNGHYDLAARRFEKDVPGDWKKLLDLHAIYDIVKIPY